MTEHQIKICPDCGWAVGMKNFLLSMGKTNGLDEFETGGKFCGSCGTPYVHRVLCFDEQVKDDFDEQVKKCQDSEEIFLKSIDMTVNSSPETRPIKFDDSMRIKIEALKLAISPNENRGLASFPIIKKRYAVYLKLLEGRS